MAKFIYKFESIQKVKKTQEKQAQKEVSIIDLEIENKKNEYEKILYKENESHNNFKKKAVSVDELKFIKGYELSLKRRRAEILKDINNLNTKRAIKMTELVQKSKEHKIFDKLEEKYNEDFQKVQNNLEMGLTDELATQKFVRRNK